jgi:hypothetical protein
MRWTAFRATQDRVGGRSGTTVAGDPGASAARPSQGLASQAGVHTDVPGLSQAQSVVYQRIAPIIIKKILEARDDNLGEFVLMNDWEWPDLMRGLGYRSANIEGNVKPGLLPAWNAIESLLQKHGYGVVKAAQPWRLIARR